MPTIQEQFGNIDIYLFDQILRGRIRPGMKILDAGCGSGRNLVYLLHEGFEVFAADNSADSVDSVRRLASQFAPGLPAENFRQEPVEAMSFPDGMADVVISSAVLHFARDREHFRSMLSGSWRVLKSGGLFFSRLASSIGIERQIKPVAAGRFLLPDGTERFLVDEAALINLTQELGGELLDPIKTTVVQNQRSMTTWVLRKR